MLDEFFCLCCRKYKHLSGRSATKIGRYKKSYQCIECHNKTLQRVEKINNPEALSGFSRFKVKHTQKAIDNRNKKSYSTDRLYNYMKDANLL